MREIFSDVRLRAGAGHAGWRVARAVRVGQWFWEMGFGRWFGRMAKTRLIARPCSKFALFFDGLGLMGLVVRAMGAGRGPGRMLDAPLRFARLALP